MMKVFLIACCYASLGITLSNVNGAQSHLSSSALLHPTIRGGLNKNKISYNENMDESDDYEDDLDEEESDQDDYNPANSNTQPSSPQPKKKAPPQKQSLQYMVTKKMRNTLTRELGYLDEEVDIMEPQIAIVVIERELKRPAKGMPTSWKRPVTATPAQNKDKDNNVKNNNKEKKSKKSLRKEREREREKEKNAVSNNNKNNKPLFIINWINNVGQAVKRFTNATVAVTSQHIAPKLPLIGAILIGSFVVHSNRQLIGNMGSAGVGAIGKVLSNGKEKKQREDKKREDKKREDKKRVDREKEKAKKEIEDKRKEESKRKELKAKKALISASVNPTTPETPISVTYTPELALPGAALTENQVAAVEKAVEKVVVDVSKHVDLVAFSDAQHQSWLDITRMMIDIVKNKLL